MYSKSRTTVEYDAHLLSVFTAIVKVLFNNSLYLVSVSLSIVYFLN